MNSYFDVYDSYTDNMKPYNSHESFSEPDNYGKIELKEPDYEDNESDMVNHPDHYMVGGMEALAVIEAKLGGPSNEMYRGYLMGNVMKYLMRSPYKGKREEDLRKAQFYLDGLVECFK